MQNNITYTAGLYLRLSKDDEQAGESVSIGTQRAILLDFCQQEGYAIHDIYIDDGYSGLNFNRPGFQRMIEDIEKGKINLVITKGSFPAGQRLHHDRLLFRNILSDERCSLHSAC